MVLFGHEMFSSRLSDKSFSFCVFVRKPRTLSLDTFQTCAKTASWAKEKPLATHPAAMQSRAPNTIFPARIVIIHIASYPYPTRALALIDCLLPSAGMEEIM